MMKFKVKMDNEEMVYSANDCIDSIRVAIDGIDGIEEYKEVFDILNEAIKTLEDLKEPYEEAYERECEEESKYENIEYMRSVL